MQRIRNILFVSDGLLKERHSLVQALRLAHNNGARLNALIVHPELPEQWHDYKISYKESLKDKFYAHVEVCRDEAKVNSKKVPIEFEILEGDLPSRVIIEYAINNKHDFIIKEAAEKNQNAGFKALDMQLLRKCKSPLWLSRSITKPAKSINIAVAIDPASLNEDGDKLSIKLLRLSSAIANQSSGELQIISCWDYPFESSLRNNVWAKVAEREIIIAVNNAKIQHRKALDKLIKKSKIDCVTKINHVKGQPDKLIPKQVKDTKVDILVMGTVARTGIPGFTMGNTAENILQTLDCTVVALKPDGFVSLL